MSEQTNQRSGTRDQGSVASDQSQVMRSLPLAPRPSPLVLAFSLIELMIAIMILGIGLVMVGTVFPVGLDMTRETVQMAISQGAADAAVATVQLKVPGYKELLPAVDNPNLQAGAIAADARVLLPNISLDPDLAMRFPNLVAIENDTDITPAEQNVLTTTPQQATPAASWNGWVPPAAFIDHCRVFTERTGWDAEHDPAGNINAYVLPGQNLPTDGYLSLTQIPTMLVPTFSPIRADMVRVHLADSVYPPVDVYMPDGVTQKPILDLLKEIAELKYSWTVFHHLISSTNIGRHMILTVVITHRGEMASRYARQQDQRTAPTIPAGVLHFDLTALALGVANADPMNSMALPKPDDDTTDTNPGNGVIDTDMQFPQPWLVLLDTVNTATGEVNCTADVARLLPAGSSFVIAQGNAATLRAGTSKEVLASSWHPTDLGNNTPPLKGLLQIKKAEINGGTFPNVPVWIFPPAIESRGTPDRFGARCPVVGVALRGVPAK